MQQQDEATDRNLVLTLSHGHIPSYALWYDEDVQKETNKQRLQWWKTFAKSKDDVIRNVAFSYIKTLQLELKLE